MLYSSLSYGTNEYARKFGFKKLEISICNPEESYYLPICPSELESAYSIENYCVYKGTVLVCSYYDDKNQFCFDMRCVSKEQCEKFGLANEYERMINSRGIEDMGMSISVPDSEILDVWETYNPIEVFLFKGPEKVWVKKNGVWLR